MIRLIVFLAFLAVLALGLSWLADRPGEIVLTWQGMRVETSLLVGLAAVAGVCIALLIFWSLLRFIFRLPSLVALTTRARRRNKGYAALSRGMIAAAAGDARYAMRATREAERLLGEDSLTLLLRAQAAQLDGDRGAAETIFSRMVERPETRLLGLRGLHAEAARRGDHHAAHLYARQAHGILPLAWAGEAVLDWHVRRSEWREALDIVDANRDHKAITRDQAARQRAALLTAKARDESDRDPEAALRDARAALKLAPALVPAAVLASQLLARRGDLRKAARLLETVWRDATHPDIAQAYVHLRPGDAARERLTRARHLAALNPRDNESAYAVARAALEAREFGAAREALAPLLAGSETRPPRRLCLLMADLEQTEHGRDAGALREWLARAARAPRDPAWIADGVISDHWEPASPVTGKLDAFQWAVPQDITDALEDTLALPGEPEPEPDPEPPTFEALPRPEREKPAAAPAEPAPAPMTRPATASSIVKAPAQALYPMPHSPDDPGPTAQEEAPVARSPFGGN